MAGRGIKRQMDERQKKVVGEALAYAGVIAFLFEIVVIFAKLVLTGDVKTCYLEIGLLIIMSIVVVVYLYVNKEYDLPKSITGKVLPVGDSKEEKRLRFSYYILDSLRLSLIFVFFTILSGGMIVPIPFMGSKILSYITEFFIEFIVFFIINYVWVEYNMKKYKKHIEMLSDDEDIL